MSAVMARSVTASGDVTSGSHVPAPEAVGYPPPEYGSVEGGGYPYAGRCGDGSGQPTTGSGSTDGERTDIGGAGGDPADAIGEGRAAGTP
ncbi:hypothetical protein [Pseudofrankia asymbiotica]|uniref:Uncharacterized protein n=1 Tax=Pseudofrankia asymbiotica TaxID=1834516 RepID=A0A1V2I682_9ACTN|nr:hypothetical protein [Pseudofrankia asymbiotica]ONH26784.1 hypothetical protein BL253_23830 [Pseudofrankia asymbiotica]